MSFTNISHSFSNSSFGYSSTTSSHRNSSLREPIGAIIVDMLGFLSLFNVKPNSTALWRTNTNIVSTFISKGFETSSFSEPTLSPIRSGFMVRGFTTWQGTYEMDDASEPRCGGLTFGGR